MESEDFEKMCLEWRKHKIEFEKHKKAMAALAKKIKAYALDDDEIKGNLHGVNFKRVHRFLVKDNAELAQGLAIEVPFITSISGTVEQIEGVYAAAREAPPAIDKSTINAKRLKVLLEEAGQSPFYGLSISMGLSTED